MGLRRIILIDPDYRFGGHVTEFLETHNMEVHYANDTRQGLWLAGTNIPDLILLSLDFPNGLGVEAIQRLRNDPAMSRIPLISIAEPAAWDSYASTVRPIVDEWMLKPCNNDELLRRIENIIGFGHETSDESEIEKTVEALLSEDASEVADLVREIQQIEDDAESEHEVRALSPLPQAAGSQPKPDETLEQTIARLEADVEGLRERISIVTSAHAVEMENMMEERQSLFDKTQKQTERVRELERVLANMHAELESILTKNAN